MGLLPSFPRRYVPDARSRIAHSFLCTPRSTVSNTYRTGLGKSGTRGNSEAQVTGSTPMINRQHARRVLNLCIIQVTMSKGLVASSLIDLRFIDAGLHLQAARESLRSGSGQHTLTDPPGLRGRCQISALPPAILTSSIRTSQHSFPSLLS